MIDAIVQEQIRIARSNRRAFLVVVILWAVSVAAASYAGKARGKALASQASRPGILSVPWVYEGVEPHDGHPAHHSQVGVADLWTPVSEGSYAEHLRLVARFRSTQVVRN